MGYMLSMKDVDDCEAFIDLLTGDSLAIATVGNPIFELKKRLVSDSEARASEKLRATDYAAIVFKSWNAWRANEPIKLLTYRAGGANPEAFPRPR